VVRKVTNSIRLTWKQRKIVHVEGAHGSKASSVVQRRAMH
jgi:hypothetical protein